MTQGAVFAGIDVAKARLDVCLWPSGEACCFANDETGRADLVRYLDRHAPAGIGLEASGGFEREVLRGLLEAGLPARRVNPMRVRQFAQACGIRAKTDAIDAAVIARFVATVEQPVARHDPVVAALAELVTARRQLCEELTRCTNQASQTRHPLLRRMASRRVKQLKADIALLDRTIAQTVAADRQLARKAALMRSVPGVGPVMTHTLIALMPELGTIPNRQASALVGVAPYACESGTCKGRRRIIGGRKAIRDVAYMAALVAGRHNAALATFRQRLIDAGKPAKVAHVAVMRKLITMLNAMIRNNQPWAMA